MKQVISNNSKREIPELMNIVFQKTPAVGAVVVGGTIDKTYFCESFGVVHRSSLAPVTKDTFFDFQSITKVMATVSLLEVFQALGKISLQDLVHHLKAQ